MPKSLICIDASFIVRLLAPDQYSDEAEKQWANWFQSGVEIIAPTLILFEVSAALRRMVYFKKLSPEPGDGLFLKFNQTKILFFHDTPLRDRTWQLAKQFNQSRTYDMHYLALAEMHNGSFWTADERLYNTVRSQLSWVHWIGTPV